jgi:hypothetical protein
MRPAQAKIIRPYLKNKAKRAGGVAHMARSLSSKHRALSSKPNTGKDINREEGAKRAEQVLLPAMHRSSRPK